MVVQLDYEMINEVFPRADDGNGGSMFVELLAHLDQKNLYARAIAEFAAGETYTDRWAKLSESRLDIALCPSSSDRQPNVADHGAFVTDYFGVMGPVGVASSNDGVENYTYLSLDPAPRAGNIGLNGMYSPDANGQFSFARGSKDALDGAANTMALGELSRFSLN